MKNVDYYLFLPVNSPGHLIPTPRDMGIEEDIWYLKNRDKPFDYNSIITEDLTLYLKNEPVEESIRPSTNYIIKIFTTIISIILFLLVFSFLLFVEYRRNRSGRKHGHA